MGRGFAAAGLGTAAQARTTAITHLQECALSAPVITTVRPASKGEEVRVTMTIEDSRGFVHHYDLTTSIETITVVLQVLAT
jgi:hypothetical protein